MSISLKQYLPVPPSKQRYYIGSEVEKHNTANDCWVILFGEVYDLTALIQSNIHSPQAVPLIKAAGRDITFWFDSVSREPRVRIEGAERVHYCPEGKYLHVDTVTEVKWWKDSKNIIGKLTKKIRRVKIINMVNDHCSVLEVPAEETINQILTRYKKYNKHGGSYEWKRLGRPLDMEKTLEQNGIIDQDGEFDKHQINHKDWYIPAVHLFFKDDLTMA